MNEKDNADQSGGTAAETTTINPNQSSTGDPQLHEESETSVTLKHAASEYICAASSLKNNIKANKLSATQENPKAPYMVRLSEVAHFLRETPGIVSIFHPKSGDTIREATHAAPVPETIEQPSDTASPPPSPDNAPYHPMQTQPTPKSADDAALRPSQAERVDVEPVAKNGKRRRNRRRGKGGIASTYIPTANQRLLKTLVGATPQERLRVIACLNELAGLIASA